jgi:hypothetical protein
VIGQLARGLLIGAAMAMFIALSWLTPAQMLADGSWWHDEGTRYRAATLMFNYIDLGVVRRGLGGTLLRLSGLHPILGLAVFHLLSSVFAAAVFCALIWQRSVPPPLRLLWTVGVASLFLFWSADSGRTDVVLAGLLGLAALQARRHPVVAAACLVLALGFHEMGLIFGLPLAVALWLDGRWRRSGEPAPGSAAAAVSSGEASSTSTPAASEAASRRALLVALALLIAAAAVQALIGLLPHADTGMTAYWFWSQFPHSQAAEWALYFYVAGARGIELAVCNNLSVDPNYRLHLACGLGVIGIALLVFNGRARRGALAPLLAAVVPFLSLSAISVDMARWSTFAAVNAWFVCVSRPADFGQTIGERDLVWRGALLCLLIFAASPRHVMPAGLDIFSPAPLVDRMIRSVTAREPSPGISVGLSRCDPTWRDLLVPDKTLGTR